MKKSVTLVFIFCLIFSSFIIHAQDFAVPHNYRFNKKSDYAKYERYIPKAVRWLEDTPPNKMQGKRKEVSAFLIKWLEGAPNVSLTLYPEVIQLAKINPDLLTLFMGSWTRFALANPEMAKDEKKGFTAGLTSLLDYYKKYKNQGLTRDRAVDAILKKKRKGQLHTWIDSVVKEDK
ncbi:MAG: hypothetical protein ACPGJS_10310 [Flammeovirgaceae bacterium]